MNLRLGERTLVPALLALGLCATGCWRFGANAPPSSLPPPPTNIMGMPSPGGPGRPPPKDKANVAGVLGAVGRVQDESDLKQIGLYYQDAISNGRPPANVEDLGIKQLAPKLYQAIVDKEFIVYWNASPLNAPAGTSNTVLGYAAGVPTNGGAVLMLDGSVRKMTPEEFKSAAKAKAGS